MTTKQRRSYGDWNEAFVLETLPTWVYTDHPQPHSLKTCRAKISYIEHVLIDIDYQIKIKQLDHEVQKDASFGAWHQKTLKAKQTYNYILNAYNNWLILNTPERTEALDLEERFDKLVLLLAEDPDDFVQRVRQLID